MPKSRAMVKNNGLPQFTMNLRWIVRRKDPNPERWAEILVGMTQKFLSSSRAAGLLLGAVPFPEEIEVLAETTAIDGEDLQVVPLYGGSENVFRENLGYLLECLPKGEAKEAAKKIGITASQLSRWRTNVENPHPVNLRGLLRFLGIDPETDLRVELLFLSMEPVSGYGKKQWMMERIKEMPAEEITKLFPALKRMLQANENY
jgi:transcriptional regulator with XRE-family HTH domain